MQRLKGWFGKKPGKRKLKTLRRRRARHNEEHYVKNAVERLLNLKKRHAGSHTLELAIQDEAAKYALDVLGLRPAEKQLEKREEIRGLVRERTLKELESEGLISVMKADIMLRIKMAKTMLLGVNRDIFFDSRKYMAEKIREAFEEAAEKPSGK